MRSRRNDIDVRATVERARALNLCGFDGVLRPPPDDLRTAIDLAEQQYDIRLARRIARFADIEPGSFAWTRDPDGLFWLGRLSGPYVYDADDAAAAVDLVHVRECRWLAEPLLEPVVPAAVLATFRRGGRNFQQTHDSSVGAESLRLWER
jgi:hypothetical protein